MSVPHVSWERMSVEDLKNYYETTTEEYTRHEKRVMIALSYLVGTGKARAFKTPDGEIVYQADRLYDLEVK